MTADIDWEAATPRSRQFDDIYYHPREGLAESRYHFLHGCGLPQAWAGCPLFVIGETGFGTGLNFLATLQLWQETRATGQRLHYVSVEGDPLSAEQLRRAHGAFGELAPFSQALLAQYPQPLDAGFHRLHLDSHGVVLDLLIGEAGERLSELQASIDAWFLDGFAPARNPAMWREAVLREVARTAAPGARLATFTAAGEVRRALARLGFAVDKSAGFGSKRERLVARFTGPAPPPRVPAWARLPIQEGRLQLMGAGIAGLSAARALARRGRDFGWTAPAQPAASTVPRALVMPRLSIDDSASARFFAQAFAYAQGQYAEQGVWQPCAALQLLGTPEKQDRGRQIAWRWAAAEYLLPAAASEQAGIALSAPALANPGAGTVDTASLLATAAAADRSESSAVTLWATGIGTTGAPPGGWLPLRAFRGQITRLAPTAVSDRLRCTLVADCFITPASAGWHMLGSTFDRVNVGDARAAAVTQADHQRNLAALNAGVDALASPDWQVLGGWAGVRAALPDRLPAVGALPGKPAFLQYFGKLRQRGRLDEPPETLCCSDLLLTGFGARGYTTAPLAAELLVSQLLGEPWPVPIAVALQLHPARFLVRALKRGEQ